MKNIFFLMFFLVLCNAGNSQVILTAAGSGDNTIIQPGGVFGINITGKKFSGSWNNYYSALEKREPFKESSGIWFFGIQGSGEGAEGDEAFALFSGGSINPKGRIEGLLGHSWLTYIQTDDNSSGYQDYKDEIEDSLDDQYLELKKQAQYLLNYYLNDLKPKEEENLARVAEYVSQASGTTKSAIDLSLDSSIALLDSSVFHWKTGFDSSEKKLLEKYRQDVKKASRTLFYDTSSHELEFTDRYKTVVSLRKEFSKISTQEFKENSKKKIFSHALYLNPGIGGEKPGFVESPNASFSQIQDDKFFWKPSAGIGYNFSSVRKYWILGFRADFLRGTNSSVLKKIKILERRVNDADSIVQSIVSREMEVLNGRVEHLWKIPLRFDFMWYRPLLSRSIGEYSDNTIGINPYIRYSLAEEENSFDIGLNLAFFSKGKFSGGFYVETTGIGTEEIEDIFQLGITANYSLHPVLNIFKAFRKTQ